MAGATEGLVEAVEQLRRRTLREILCAKEELDEHLPVEASEAFRFVVVDQINHFARVASSLVTAAEGAAVNQLWLERIVALLDDDGRGGRNDAPPARLTGDEAFLSKHR